MTPPVGEKTLEIARRTRRNLKYIYEAKEHGADVEEFTQLLNSMLSMVISLREDYFKGSEIGWKYVEQLGLESWDPGLQHIKGNTKTAVSPSLGQIDLFSDLINKLRHAFAHNCFEHIVNEDRTNITGVRVWNIPFRKRNLPVNRIWEADILENELKSLAYLFVEFLEKELD